MSVSALLSLDEKLIKDNHAAAVATSRNICAESKKYVSSCIICLAYKCTISNLSTPLPSEMFCICYAQAPRDACTPLLPACLHNACLHNACLHNACLHNACLHNACLHNACLHNACLHNACLHNAFLPASLLLPCLLFTCMLTTCIIAILACLDDACRF